MNWKFTRPTTVHFAQGEPVAMVVPQPRGHLESYSVYVLPIEAAPQLDDQYRGWATSRAHFNAHEIKPGLWQKHYMLGTDAPAGQHKRRQRLDSPAPK